MIQPSPTLREYDMRAEVAERHRRAAEARRARAHGSGRVWPFMTGRRRRGADGFDAATAAERTHR